MPSIIPIDDPDDPRIDAYRDIRERDLVGRAGLFIAEGRVVLEKLVGSTRFRPVSLLIAAKRLASLDGLLAELPDDVPVFACEQAVFDRIAGFPVHRGILAIARQVDKPTPDALLESAEDVLFLSAIANHDNMGGIFRNAAAFGIGAVLLDPDCCDPLYRKAIRVSVGATLLVPFARLDRGEDALALFERHEVASVALSPAGDTLLHGWRPAARNALLLGAEGPGLSPALLARTRSLRIAMANGFDSLNVATTSGIVLHHLSAYRV
ncbi:RNA methyltransferase [Sphingomonas rosea]|uniref:RNA methyltransferase n=1 Tax=Sphingomonas rosea TaxID=335605 RepID=A0ABP7U996_9SPHN